MPPKSSMSVRVTEVPNGVTRDEFFEEAKKIVTEPGKRSENFNPGGFTSLAVTAEKVRVSLAPQFGEQFGTVTFPYPLMKEKALKEKWKWKYDDIFDGITVLHSSQFPKLDICAVHGLNGNAFETWSTADVMWPRDLLPNTIPFNDSRIMTFGYKCQWANKKTLSGLPEWSNDLLDRVCSVRITEEEKQRPIIFICHSLGGLVARQAMIRLNAYPHLFSNIRLERCAILFLATPHLGSSEADWNKYLVDLVELIGGLRADAIVNPLRSFNPMSATANEDFGNMRVKLPYECYYETELTRVGGKNRQVVGRASATLNGKAAFPIANVDHNSICKYDSKVRGGYLTIISSLTRLQGLLLRPEQDVYPVTTTMQLNPSGMPPLDARYYPLPMDKKWYEGKGLRTSNHMKRLRGRQDEIRVLQNIVATCHTEGASAIAVTGIGGIGKTEMLLEVAYRCLNRTNIFFVRATDRASLDDAYFHVARRLGHDILLDNNRGKPTLDIWNNMSREEKVEKFRDWLKQPGNAETLFVLDDLDGLRDPELILSAVPNEAKTVLFSTRNPVLRHDLDQRLTHQLRLPSMNTDELVQVMDAVPDKIDYEAEGDILDNIILREIAVALHGHPLAAIIAIRYITRVIAQEGSGSPENDFLAILQGSDFEARKRFLEYKASGPSIMDTFLVSKNRLQRQDIRAWDLLQFIAVLETDQAIIDFRKFFYYKLCSIAVESFPDHELLAAKNTEISEALAEIETVSFGERVHMAKPIQFHPLWIECTLQAMGRESRIRHIRQVLRICYLSVQNTSEDALPQFLPHVQRCLRVCESFQIFGDLGLDEAETEWVYVVASK